MKNMILKFGLYAAAMLTFGFLLNSCVDEPDKFELAAGKPTVYYVRPMNAASVDSLLTSAYMGNGICIVGDNLRSVYKLMFNDQAAVLNNSYITDHTILVNVPNEIPGEVSNLMYLITQAADTVKYDFQVLVPSPTISSMKNEFAPAGSTSILYGDYFVDDPNVPIQLFVGEVEAKISSFTKGSIQFTVPQDAVANSPIKVKTIYGEAKSSFNWKDSRGTLFNFDNDPHPTNHGWHAMVIETDETALDGNFLRLGAPDVTMSADGGWDDGHFCFEYWPGDWDDPVSYADSPRLTDFVDFSDWEKMSLKFELYIPSSNPWMAGSMQLIHAGVDKITDGAVGAIDIDGNVTGGANNTFFHDTPLPRGLYTPWKATGSFDTGDEWITVTVPYSNFIYTETGGVATGSLSASDFTSLTIFVWSGGNKGTDCQPVLKIDNIRAVPNK